MKIIFSASWVMMLVIWSSSLLAAEGSGHFQLQGDTLEIYEDGIHDPENDGSRILQPPYKAMANLPRDDRGVVDWVVAIDEGLVTPRTGKVGNEKMHSVDFDVIFKNTASMPYVRFPHLAHTKWLTCQNCHPMIFLPQKGGNYVSMAAIIQGEYCGVCHGKVAFPATGCARCHNVPRKSVGLR